MDNMLLVAIGYVIGLGHFFGLYLIYKKDYQRRWRVKVYKEMIRNDD